MDHDPPRKTVEPVNGNGLPRHSHQLFHPQIRLEMPPERTRQNPQSIPQRRAAHRTVPHILHPANSAGVQILREYKSCGSTNPAGVQILREYKSCGSTNPAGVQILREYKSCGSTNPAGVQILWKRKFCGSTNSLEAQLVSIIRDFLPEM